MAFLLPLLGAGTTAAGVGGAAAAGGLGALGTAGAVGAGALGAAGAAAPGSTAGVTAGPTSAFESLLGNRTPGELLTERLLSGGDQQQTQQAQAPELRPTRSLALSPEAAGPAFRSLFQDAVARARKRRKSAGLA